MDERVFAGDRLKASAADFCCRDGRAECVALSLGLRGRSRPGARSTVSNDEATSRFQGIAQCLQRRSRIGQLVIRIEDQHSVHALSVETRILFVQHDMNLPITAQQSSNPQESQRLPLHIGGDDASGGSHYGGQANREVSASGAEINNRVAGLHIQRFDQLCGPLPGVSFTFDLLEPHERESGLPRHVAE